MKAQLDLGFGLSFEELYTRDGLVRIDNSFRDDLRNNHADLEQRLLSAREGAGTLSSKQESDLILELAPFVDRFVGLLFGIAEELDALSRRHLDLAPLSTVKREFVQRKASAAFKADEACAFDGDALWTELLQQFGFQQIANGNTRGDPSIETFEYEFAVQVTRWLQEADKFASNLDSALRYAAWALQSPSGRRRHREGTIFKTPAKIDPHNLLLHARREVADGVVSYTIQTGHARRREGFSLTDHGTDLVGALDQANYCIRCHNQGKDSCCKGLVEKIVARSDQADAPASAPQFKKNVFGVKLAGCPLQEKISEFHSAKIAGLPIGALAIIVVDNPLVAATGHRICNDCMKACIFQKQEPVNIPQAETRTLKDILELPWGFEIYSLLTRWNPLNFHRPYPKPASGHKILVVGMGPAGFGLAHQLLNEGVAVVGIDGLKIEPLPEIVAGVSRAGRVPFFPIHDVSCLREDLDTRVTAGFGGVAEYGITVRWDKNFLKIVRILLERRRDFALFGGVRFGGTITADDAFASGFDHVALCIGAGRPTVLDIHNGLAPGVRAASDFLMALQLTGAAKSDSIANMQVRLPVVIVGGGLTAIDTATEALAYYPLQVEKFLARYEQLSDHKDGEQLTNSWSEQDRVIANEFLAHGRALREERSAAAREGREPKIVSLLQSWGGITVAYRRRLVDSPAYTLNHEEVEKALEEGITFSECLSPVAIDTDQYGSVDAMRLTKIRKKDDGGWEDAGEHRLPARTVFVAAGTQPNTVLAREDEDHFPLDGKYFKACDENGTAIEPEFSSSKPARADVLLSKTKDGRFISYLGDVHPSFFGNVVKALGSAKQGYPVIMRVLNRLSPASAIGSQKFFSNLSDQLNAKIYKVERLTSNIVEVIVRAPAAARKFQPGQFYRFQNFASNSTLVSGTQLQMEAIALTGAWVDPQRGLVSLIVLEMGGSSNLCATLAPDEDVVLMGPTGVPTHIQSDELVVLVGGGLGNAVLFSIGKATRAAGSKVLYFAGYKSMEDRYKVDDIERAADVVVWCCDEAPGFVPRRPHDVSFIGNIVQAMLAYTTGSLGTQMYRFEDADRIVAIGSDRMMAAVARARHNELKPYLKKEHIAVGSINSPMQCMMKEVCAQCLQAHRDPDTGATRYVFSCANQDQDLDRVDFAVLNGRLRQNAVQEKITAQWISHCRRANAQRQ